MKPDSSNIVSTKHWHKLEDGRVQCDVCPRFCKLREGDRGLCFVRQCLDDQIVLTTYGRSSGFCVDPIEKKPLNHFLPGTPVLSFGTAGCNLACKFCQNWDISKSREIDTLADQASPEVMARVAKDLGCRSVAFTYNDPTIFMEYAIDVAKACHDHGVKTVAVSAGYMAPKARQEFYQYIDAANIDLKAFTDEFYHKICGGHLDPVLETLKYLKNETPVWLELTTLLIPEENDSPDELKKMTEWVVNNLGPDVPMHFSSFHPDWKMRDKKSTPPETVIRARQIAIDQGVKYAYTGNLYNPEGEHTYCSGCHKVVIGRSLYTITDWKLTPDGRCLYCQQKCCGVIEATPGHWGSRRLPVNLSHYSETFSQASQQAL